MITNLKAYSRAWIESFARYGEGSRFPFKNRRWHLISIHTNDTVNNEDDQSPKFATEENLEKLRMIGLAECLSLRFWDITEKNVQPMIEAGYSPVLFDKDMAKQVVDFIAARRDEPGEDVLVAHCDMGVKRSGAVIEFACEFLGLDREEMLRSNPNILANVHVLLTLREAAGMSLRTQFTQAMEEEKARKQQEILDLIEKYGSVFF